MNVRPSIALSRVSADGDPELLLMHYRYNGHDVYALPGGNPDRGETLPQTLKRELMEELGIEIIPGYMVVCGDVIQPERKDDTLHVVFSGGIAAGEPKLNSEQTTALAIVWKPINDLSNLNLYPDVGNHLQQWLSEPNEPRGYIGPINQAFF